jgi:hypothetical protein
MKRKSESNSQESGIGEETPSKKTRVKSPVKSESSDAEMEGKKVSSCSYCQGFHQRGEWGKFHPPNIFGDGSIP